MTYRVIPPKLPSWKRYRKIFCDRSGCSVLRALEYEKLLSLDITGKILDLGGGDNASYRHWFEGGQYESINIDPKLKPTWLVGEKGEFPVGAGTYDIVISMNTLEHIYDSGHTLVQMYRALKKGGSLILTVPFMYPLHAHPDDYFRATPSWWRKTLAEVGFERGEVNPLVWGPVSTGMTVSGIMGPFKTTRTHLKLMLDIAYARLRFMNGGDDYSGEAGKSICNSALGYFIQAYK